MDVFDPQKRSEIMSRVRGKNTKPELHVRSYLHRVGFRYVTHDRRLPGTPDISFPSRRLAIFVHGCFWHGHEGCKKATIPSTRSEFWRTKIEGNKERDKINRFELEALGWDIRVVWQCSINADFLQSLATEISAKAVIRYRRPRTQSRRR